MGELRLAGAQRDHPDRPRAELGPPGRGRPGPPGRGPGPHRRGRPQARGEPGPRRGEAEAELHWPAHPRGAARRRPELDLHHPRALPVGVVGDRPLGPAGRPGGCRSGRPPGGPVRPRRRPPLAGRAGGQDLVRHRRGRPAGGARPRPGEELPDHGPAGAGALRHGHSARPRPATRPREPRGSGGVPPAPRGAARRRDPSARDPPRPVPRTTGGDTHRPSRHAAGGARRAARGPGGPPAGPGRRGAASGRGRRRVSLRRRRTSIHV